MDLEKLPTHELEQELRRRRDKARKDEIARREKIAEVLQDACDKVEGFQDLLIPNAKGELATAVFRSCGEYEITLSSYYNPLKEEE